MNKTQNTARKAHDAIRSLIEQGKSISVYAVEMEAGLTNGTLKYKCEEYKGVNQKISDLKRVEVPNVGGNKDGELKKAKELRDKYRGERNSLRAENEQLQAQNKELLYNLFQLQRWVEHLESKGIENPNVVKIDFSSRRM